MSAFMCSDLHLTALAAYAVRHGLSGIMDDRLSPSAMVKRCFGVLHRQNVASLDARYPNDTGREIGKVDEKAMVSPFPLITIIKQCHCYAYQACETTAWETSQAKAIVDRIEAHAVRALPGYEAAPWGL